MYHATHQLMPATPAIVSSIQYKTAQLEQTCSEMSENPSCLSYAVRPGMRSRKTIGSDVNGAVYTAWPQLRLLNFKDMSD